MNDNNRGPGETPAETFTRTMVNIAGAICVLGAVVLCGIGVVLK